MAIATVTPTDAAEKAATADPANVPIDPIPMTSVEPTARLIPVFLKYLSSKKMNPDIMEE